MTEIWEPPLRRHMLFQSLYPTQFLKSQLSSTQISTAVVWCANSVSNAIFTSQEYKLGCWHLHIFFFDMALEWQPRKVLHSPPVFCQQRKWWSKSCCYLLESSPPSATTFGHANVGFQDFLVFFLASGVDYNLMVREAFGVGLTAGN